MQFPILTSPSSKRDDFLHELQRMADSDFSEIIIVSPFVDHYIIDNFIRRCVFNQRKLTVITRYGGRGLNDRQRAWIDEAIAMARQYATSKDPSLSDRVTWLQCNRVHAKLVIRDWTQVLFGSQNLTERGGLTGNFELGALIQNDTQVTRLRDFVADIIKASRPLFP